MIFNDNVADSINDAHDVSIISASDIDIFVSVSNTDAIIIL